MVRLTIADDHAIVRSGLKQLFAMSGDIDVVGEAENGAELLSVVGSWNADLLLLDLTMPGISGVRLIGELRERVPDLRILVLSMHDELPVARRALNAGALGFVTKGSSPETLLAAVRKVAAGRRYIAATLLIFAIAGVTAFVGVSRSAVLSLALTFEFATVLPMCVWLFRQGDQIHEFMGIASLLYLGMLYLLLKKMNAMSLHAQQLNDQNLQLSKERQQALDELAQREQNFHSLAENLPDNVARWDVEGRYLYINPTHERVLGATVEELAGTLIPDSHTTVKVAIAQVVATGRTIRSMRQPVVVDGVEELHDVSLTPEFDEAGRIVSVLGIGRNMTAFYRMQDEIAERESQFRSLAESSPDYIVRYDREQRILYMNRKLLDELGLDSLDAVLGKRPDEVWPDGRFNLVQDGARRAIEERRPVRVELVAPLPEGGSNIPISSWCRSTIWRATSSVRSVSVAISALSARPNGIYPRPTPLSNR